MTVTTSYPGIYIQELPSLVHTITPAPTSTAVFVGYINPFYALKPPVDYNTAIQLFSFADYQANFGGFFSCPWQPDYVGQAVNQFFLNGGPTCYVVALQPQHYYNSKGEKQGDIGAASCTLKAEGGDITLTALQPVGVGTAGISMAVALSNLQSSAAGGPKDTADIVISYGTTVETYRKVQIATLAAKLQNSSLVTVTVTGTPDGLPAGRKHPARLQLSRQRADRATGGLHRHQPSGLRAGVPGLRVARQGTDLQPARDTRDHRQPGHCQAVAYCERKRAFYIADTPSSEAPQLGRQQHRDQPLISPPALSPAPPLSTNAAVYYPWLQTTDPVTGKQQTRSGMRVRRRADTWPGSTARRTARKGSGSPRRASRRPSLARRAWMPRG